MKDANNGIRTSDKDLTNVCTLVDVQNCVEDFSNTSDSITLDLDKLQKDLSALIADNIGKETEMKQVEKLYDEFDQLKKAAEKTKREIAPLVFIEALKNISSITNLQYDLMLYQADLKKRDFYKYSCGHGPALK